MTDLFDPAALLSESERADYEERAAIREYDGGMERQEAERAALQDVMRARRTNGKAV
jgi:hypothetical protein